MVSGSSAVVAGRYRLLREVGRGGMGAVWLARDEVLGREVAIKRVGLLPGSDQADVERVAREARVSAMLNHEHVVSVFDLVDDGGQHWLVMEYVESRTLGDLIRSRGRLSPDETARLVAQAAEALAAAHRAGIVHRDVKPSNMLVTPDDRLKLGDFGIARTGSDPTLTQTGMVTGSPAYLAPEVATGRPATPASDIWSLGATIFHAVSGSPPYDTRENLLGALYRIAHEEPPRTELAGWLDPVLRATMHRDPGSRWSAGQVLAFLQQGAGRAGSPPAAAVPSTEPDDEDGERTAIVPEAAGAAASSATGPAEPADPPEPRSRRRRRASPLALLAALVVVLLVAFSAWLFLRGDPAPEDGGAGGRASDTSSATSESPPTPSGPSAEGMETFVTDYLATVTSDPEAAWQRLTPEFQQASGGYDGYLSWWGTVQHARVNSIDADPDALRVTYNVTYTMKGGPNSTQDVTLALDFQDGQYLISDEL